MRVLYQAPFPDALNGNPSLPPVLDCTVCVETEVVLLSHTEEGDDYLIVGLFPLLLREGAALEIGNSLMVNSDSLNIISLQDLDRQRKMREEELG